MKTQYKIYFLLFAFCLSAVTAHAETDKKKLKKTSAKTSAKNVAKANVKPAAKTKGTAKSLAIKSSPTKHATAKIAPDKNGADMSNDRQLNAALEMVKAGRYQDASIRLFALSRNPAYAAEHMHIKYLLGLMLYEMKLNQVASYQFVSVVKDGSSRYIKKALEKLSITASNLNDRTLLNFAMAKVDLQDFPKEYHDLLKFRIGEYEYEKGVYKKAAQTLGGVSISSPYYSKAKYLQAISYVSEGELEQGEASYRDIIDSRKEFGPTDTNAVSAWMGVARTLYQKKKWDEAISTYHDIPRDTKNWHDAMFEKSWAQLRGGKFRSVLSNFHSLHSPFYEDYYQPESLLLRGILYLYICQYDEMQKTLDLFEKIYTPVQNKIRIFLSDKSASAVYFSEMEKIMNNYQDLLGHPEKRDKYKVPFIIARAIMNEGDFKSAYSYLQNLRQERKNWMAMAGGWRSAAIGSYSNKLLQNRVTVAEGLVGSVVKAHLIDFNKQLSQHFEQQSFARYELVNSRKERIKKGLTEMPTAKTADGGESRDYYIQNGYDYYPFGGEYWLDELGNYYYIGNRSCE